MEGVCEFLGCAEFRISGGSFEAGEAVWKNSTVLAMCLVHGAGTYKR